MPGSYRSPAAWSSFIYATSPGPLLLEVRGDPFGDGPAALGRTIAAAMTAGIPARPFALTTTQANAARPNFRVVVVLGGAPSLDERAICAGHVAVEPLKVLDGRVDLTATFCDGQSLLSSVRGWVARIDGIDDRRFRLLLNQMARELMGSPP